MREVKSYRRVCQCVARHQRVDVATLGRVRFQELQSRGNAVEQVLDGDDRAGRRAGLRAFEDLPAVDANACPDFLGSRAGDARHLRDGGDRGQRLAAKAERLDA